MRGLKYLSTITWLLMLNGCASSTEARRPAADKPAPTWERNVPETATTAPNPGTGRAAAPEAVDSDRNGLPDWWEIRHFGHIGVDPNAASGTGDGYTIRQEFELGRDPKDFFNGETPVLRTISGENQSRVSGFQPNPVVIQVYHADQKTPWPNAPVTLNVVEGDGKWAPYPNGPTTTKLELRADANGQIAAYYWLP